MIILEFDRKLQCAVRIQQWRRGSKWLFRDVAVSEFSSSQEIWTAYVERLEQYLAATKIEDADQQRAILPAVSVHGPATYRLICSMHGVTQKACRTKIQRHCRNCPEAL